MDIRIDVPPTPSSDASARAGESPARTTDAAPQAPFAPELVASVETVAATAETASVRAAEEAALLEQLAALSLDPDGNGDAIDELTLRTDLAAMRYAGAEDAMAQAFEEAEALAAQTLAVTPVESHRVMFLEMADVIAAVKAGFVKEAQDATSGFIEFLREYLAITGELKNAISPNTAKDKEGYVIVKFDDLRSKLDAFIEKWKGRPLGTFSSEADARAFLQEAGLIDKDFPVRNQDGQWIVDMPFHVAVAQRDSMPAEPVLTVAGITVKGAPISWSNAEYQAWLSGSNARTEGLQDDSRILLERLKKVTETYDNLNSTLSQALQAIHDADKLFAQNL